MNKIKEFNKKLSSIKYGWYDKDGNLYESLSKKYNFKDNYRMQDINNLKDHAICWELCEVERKYFKENKIKYKTIMILYNDKKKMPNHTFLVFKMNDKYYWFESSWEKEKGIKEYNSMNELLNYLRENFEEFTREKDYDRKKIVFYSYFKPRKRIKCNPFYMNCMYLGRKLKKNYKF